MAVKVFHRRSPLSDQATGKEARMGRLQFDRIGWLRRLKLSSALLYSKVPVMSLFSNDAALKSTRLARSCFPSDWCYNDIYCILVCCEFVLETY